MAFSFSGRFSDPAPIKGAQFTPKKDEIVAIGTWSHDLTRDMVQCSNVKATLFGLSPGEAEHDVPFERIIEAVHPSDRKRFRDAVNAAASHGGPFFAEYRVVSASGEVRRILDRGEFYKNAAGIVDRARGVVIDLTDYVPATLKTKTVSAERRCLNEPLAVITDHCLAAWNIGQQLPPEVFDTLKPAFQNLLIELGLRIAETEMERPAQTSRKSSLH